MFRVTKISSIAHIRYSLRTYPSGNTQLLLKKLQTTISDCTVVPKNNFNESNISAENEKLKKQINDVSGALDIIYHNQSTPVRELFPNGVGATFLPIIETAIKYRNQQYPAWLKEVKIKRRLFVLDQSIDDLRSKINMTLKNQADHAETMRGEQKIIDSCTANIKCFKDELKLLEAEKMQLEIPKKNFVNSLSQQSTEMIDEENGESSVTMNRP
ncbi:MAG TPA: hypothetical protein VJN02_08260 [Gammaproteobacteria bacterium]|nr:hypothetical protein [Gammaproteobacteria bacterium]